MTCKHCNAETLLIGGMCHLCCDETRAAMVASVADTAKFFADALAAHGQPGETFAQMWERVLAERKAALAGQISGFYEDEYPGYAQGAPTHELQELATAEEVNALVNRLRSLEEGKAVAVEALAAARKQLLERIALDRDSDQLAAVAINHALQKINSNPK